MDALDLGTQFIPNPSASSSKRSLISGLLDGVKTYPRLLTRIPKAPEGWKQNITQRATERAARDLAALLEVDSHALTSRAKVTNPKKPKALPARNSQLKKCIFTMGNVSSSRLDYLLPSLLQFKPHAYKIVRKLEG